MTPDPWASLPVYAGEERIRCPVCPVKDDGVTPEENSWSFTAGGLFKGADAMYRHVTGMHKLSPEVGVLVVRSAWEDPSWRPGHGPLGGVLPSPVAVIQDAAAPDLLISLQHALALIDSLLWVAARYGYKPDGIGLVAIDAVQEAGRAAVAKAKGE
jgi:hypothetical protein